MSKIGLGSAISQPSLSGLTNWTLSLTSGDVVWVRFPLVERDATMRRPAVLLSARAIGTKDIPLLWALMITNARRPSWPGDVLVPDHLEAGLNIPCKVRTAKVSTIEARAAERVGRLPNATIAAIWANVAATLGVAEARA